MTSSRELAARLRTLVQRAGTGLRVRAATIGCALLALSQPCPSAAQQVLKGGVQQNRSTPVPADLAASCGRGSYFARGDCDRLSAYLAAGGNEPTCLSLWRQAIALDLEIESLSNPQAENSNPSLGQRQGQLSKQLAGIEYQIDTKCPPPAPSTVQPDTIAANPSPTGVDEIGADTTPGGLPGPGPDQRGDRLPKQPSGQPKNGNGGNGNVGRQPPPPRPRPQTPAVPCSGPWILTSHDMDSVVFAGYRTQPILLAALCNWPNAWLVTMSGYQTANVWWLCVWTNTDCAGKYGQATGVQEIFATSLGMQDNYSFSLVQGMLAKHVPLGSAVVLAGHSLGGMVAQSLPVNAALGFSNRWRAVRILTFGAPIMNQGVLPAAMIRRFATQGYALWLTQTLQIDPVVRLAPDWYADLKLPAPVPFALPTSSNTTLVGVQGQWSLPVLHVSYPNSPDLKGYDALGNSPGATYLELDSTRMWRLPVGNPFLAAPPPEQRGLTATDDVFLQNYARANKLTIVVRDANPFSSRWIGVSGYAPKPKVIKAKTLKPADCANTRLLGLAAARDASDSAYYASIGFTVAGRASCHVLSSGNGTRYYSDADLHGVYRAWLPGVGSVDQWQKDSIGLARAINQGLTAPMVQHGPQDDWDKRNSRRVIFNKEDVENGAYGPLPPATAYLPEGGTAHLKNRWQMKEFYQTRGIDWLSIYPNSDEQ